MSKTGTALLLVLVILLGPALEISVYACLRHGFDNSLSFRGRNDGGAGEYDKEQEYDFLSDQ